MALEREQAVYNSHLFEFISASEGRFVAIKGDDIAGPFDDYEGALRSGYSRFGVVPFLVKQVLPHEPVLHFARDLPPCRD